MAEYLQVGINLGISFLITIIIGPLLIPILRRIKAGQSIREDGPQSHLTKAGTPTMGGIMIIAAALITCITMGGRLHSDMIVLLLTFLAFAAIGFVDDFVKVSKKRNLGLTAKQKLVLQIIIAVILAIYQSKVSIYGTSIYVPIVKTYLDLGYLYIPFVVFVVIAMVNAVNLTDGLDGLAGGITMIVMLFLSIVGCNLGFTSATVYCAAIAGGCLGFLVFNHYPAKVFMGDTGSLALGGAVAAAGILMNIELILPIAGGIYVLEALSVVIQVFWFKRTGRRVFRMAPIHHHFELGGWKETKVVAVFWLITLLLCTVSMLML